MPRYYFHVCDGRRHTDSEGLVLPGLRAARVEAQRFAGEVIRDKAERADFGAVWSLEVADEADLVLFCMNFSVTEPASSSAREPIPRSRFAR